MSFGHVATHCKSAARMPTPTPKCALGGPAEAKQRVEHGTQLVRVALPKRDNDVLAKLELEAGGQRPMEEATHDQWQHMEDVGHRVRKFVGVKLWVCWKTGRPKYQSAKIVPDNGQPCRIPLSKSMVVTTPA